MKKFLVMWGSGVLVTVDSVLLATPREPVAGYRERLIHEIARQAFMQVDIVGRAFSRSYADAGGKNVRQVIRWTLQEIKG